MKNIFLNWLIILCCFSVHSQKVISGIVYKDTTMNETICDVKIVFKSVKNNKTVQVKTDVNGYFSFIVQEPYTEYNIVLKKKKYIPINIKSFSIPKKAKESYFKIVLKKMLPIHDENYEGTSRIISVDER